MCLVVFLFSVKIESRLLPFANGLAVVSEDAAAVEYNLGATWKGFGNADMRKPPKTEARSFIVDCRVCGDLVRVPDGNLWSVEDFFGS